MELGLIIKNLLILGAIIGTAFASQVPFFASKSNSYAYPDQLKNASDWVKEGVSGASARVGIGLGGSAERTNNPAELGGGASAFAQEIETQKNNFFQNAFDSSRKFVAQEILDVLHVAPEDLGCPAE